MPYFPEELISHLTVFSVLVLFFSLASPFLYFTLLWPILSMSFCTLAHFCQLPLSVHLCSWAFTNLSFLHFRTLSTVLSASASENLCYVGNFELFSFVYGCFSSFRTKLTFFFFSVSIWHCLIPEFWLSL